MSFQPQEPASSRASDSEASAPDGIEGSCLCRRVRYRIRRPWQRFVHCHCSRCRKATGTGHASNLVVAPDQLDWLAGEDSVVRYDLPQARSFATCFCRECGSPLPHKTRSGSAVIVPAGSLDGDPGLRPQARIYWPSRAAWEELEDQLERFDDGGGG